MVSTQLCILLRLLTTWCRILDSLHLAFITYTLYYYLVMNFFNPLGLFVPIWWDFSYFWCIDFELDPQYRSLSVRTGQFSTLSCLWLIVRFVGSSDCNGACAVSFLDQSMILTYCVVECQWHRNTMVCLCVVVPTFLNDYRLAHSYLASLLGECGFVSSSWLFRIRRRLIYHTVSRGNRLLTGLSVGCHYIWRLLTEFDIQCQLSLAFVNLRS